MTEREKIKDLLDVITEICEDIRERTGEDWICGLCEYDWTAEMECPGFETNECFKLSERFKAKYLKEEDHHEEM